MGRSVRPNEFWPDEGMEEGYVVGKFSAGRRRELKNWGVNGARLSVVVNLGRVRRR